MPCKLTLCRFISLLVGWGWDADGVGATGADGATADGLKGFAHADFDGCEVVVAATECEAGSGEGWVALSKEGEDFAGRHGDLMGERGQF